jgi:hypothetical protein
VSPTPHEHVAPAIHEVLEGSTAYVEPTEEITVEQIQAAIADLAADWRIDVEHQDEGARVAITSASRRPDSLVDQPE